MGLRSRMPRDERQELQRSGNGANPKKDRVMPASLHSKPGGHHGNTQPKRG